VADVPPGVGRIVTVNFSIGDDYVEVEAHVETVDRTGVEMEALTACTVAALTVYDMCKSSDRTMTIEQVCLWEKSGGRSGHGVARNSLMFSLDRNEAHGSQLGDPPRP